MDMMNTATLMVLDRALSGDAGALSFLERTSSLYVLDMTTPNHPKTYGSWNFVNEALNEVDRLESQGPQRIVNIEAHLQLLCSMCKRAARRSSTEDRSLVRICLDNAAQYHGSTAMCQVFVDDNSSLRERVMGRIAAIAFDFSYHRGPSAQSPFSSLVAMEGLCAVLAANAIANGRGSISHFMMDWIVPSIASMPPRAAVAVTLHLANEGIRKSAPDGTRKALLELVPSVVSVILGPALTHSISEEEGSPNYQLAALTILSLERWCTVTSMSGTQIKFLCSMSSMKSDFIGVLSDAFYADSPAVMDALADLISALLEKDPVDENRLEISRVILNQPELSTRYQEIQQDKDQEEQAMLQEFMEAISLQRFRFVGRQTNDDGTFRCLARIASAIFKASFELLRAGRQMRSVFGLVDILLKASAHPIIHVCALAQECLPSLLILDSEVFRVDPSYALRILPLLQQRAIIPHQYIGGVPNLDAVALCGIDFNEFLSFRENLLQDVLIACYQNCRREYVESCTSAVEEFCDPGSRGNTSFQLEAALFCLGTVSIEIMKAIDSNWEMDDNDEIAAIVTHHEENLKRCLVSLGTRPQNLISNPLTLSQASQFLRKYAKVFTRSSVASETLAVAADLCMYFFSTSLTSFRGKPVEPILSLMTSSPFTEASLAVQSIMHRGPSKFTDSAAIAALQGAWGGFYRDEEFTRSVTREDRKAFCSGVCTVLSALPSEKWCQVLSTFASPTIEYLEALTTSLEEAATAGNDESQIIERISCEIDIVTCIIRSFDRALNNSDSLRLLGNDSIAQIQHPSLLIVQRSWPCISHLAKNQGKKEEIAESILSFFRHCIPMLRSQLDTRVLLNEMGTYTKTIGDHMLSQHGSLDPVTDLILEVLDVFGASLSSIDDVSPADQPLSVAAGEFLGAFTSWMHQACLSSMGPSWRGNSEQMQGQRPFESRTSDSDDDVQMQTDAIQGLFQILTKCLQQYPVIMAKIHPHGTPENYGDILLRSALDMAIDSINSNQVDTCRAAMLFLSCSAELPIQSLQMDQSNTTDSIMVLESKRHVSNTIENAISRQRLDIVKKVLFGVSGVFHRPLLDPAAYVLFSILRGSTILEAESCCRIALKSENFALGDAVRQVTLAVLGRCATGSLEVVFLMDFLDDLWQLHQREDGDVVGNDAINYFVEQYRSRLDGMR
eukprot:CAMPEP_0118704478 /NCGR_PEP_ID=MMETSP0800-20121206/19262_1 /TAXON_ID=210618 ORGANISM="Striatella unipunctata, Strain CCMP2910" /NCGR_SAMPLE_ID=MMETSP0800 /ASSEMBLY_ACC=CAM_ASM_000638 /LENGTH=1184 /DNA_ID=CAMNT_0006606381 /DNA_START=223 /DNA_END=3777 /DNA_ORIENTATION=+